MAYKPSALITSLTFFDVVVVNGPIQLNLGIVGLPIKQYKSAFHKTFKYCINLFPDYLVSPTLHIFI